MQLCIIFIISLLLNISVNFNFTNAAWGKNCHQTKAEASNTLKDDKRSGPTNFGTNTLTTVVTTASTIEATTENLRLHLKEHELNGKERINLSFLVNNTEIRQNGITIHLEILEGDLEAFYSYTQWNVNSEVGAGKIKGSIFIKPEDIPATSKEIFVTVHGKGNSMNKFRYGWSVGNYQLLEARRAAALLHST